MPMVLQAITLLYVKGISRFMEVINVPGKEFQNSVSMVINMEAMKNRMTLSPPPYPSCSIFHVQTNYN